MVTKNDVPINDVIIGVAEELKKDNNVKAPEWAVYVKTGVHKERPPQLKDWWYTRCAAILLSVQKLGVVGVSKLRTKYGGRKNRGHKPDAFRKASGSILRKALQQLEKAELVKKDEKGTHKGRAITPKGVSLIDRTAKAVRKA